MVDYPQDAWHLLTTKLDRSKTTILPAEDVAERLKRTNGRCGVSFHPSSNPSVTVVEVCKKKQSYKLVVRFSEHVKTKTKVKDVVDISVNGASKNIDDSIVGQQNGKSAGEFDFLAAARFRPVFGRTFSYRGWS